MEKIGRERVEEILSGCLDENFNKLSEPTKEDWKRVENTLGIKFAEDFKDFIDLTSKYSFPGDILGLEGYTESDTIDFTYKYEMNDGDWDEDMFPFYSIGNGDYICVSRKESPNSPVYYVSHDDDEIEKESEGFGGWLNELPEYI